MPQPTLYVVITNHGFGHTTRSAAVVDAIQRQSPELKVIVASTAPQWLLDSYITGEYDYHSRAFDIGVIQSDSVHMDKQATLEKLQHIRAQAEAIAAAEAILLRQNNVGLVLADIPPLATKIAHAADIPCWMTGNFGWDFIYQDWQDEWDGAFTEVIQWIAGCFGECDRLFRLPFHEPMKAFPHIEDIGLTGGVPYYSETELRQIFNITAPPDKTALITFGGLGLDAVPYDGLRDRPDWQFITFDHQPPSDLPNLLKVTDRTYRPVDFMPLCGQIISKPGYSTFSEACMVGVPVKTVEREGFAEAPILIEGIKCHAHHRILTLAELYEGTWEFLDQPCDPPTTDDELAKDGNGAIAQAVADYLQTL